MRYVSTIIGYRKRCFNCGADIWLVMIPTISDRWQVCEEIVGEPQIIRLHDCPRHPSKTAATLAD